MTYILISESQITEEVKKRSCGVHERDDNQRRQPLSSALRTGTTAPAVQRLPHPVLRPTGPPRGRELQRTLDDLETFWKSVVSMKPWDYDHFALPGSHLSRNQRRTLCRFTSMWNYLKRGESVLGSLSTGQDVSREVLPPLQS
ncbi:hypothetical protein JOM56_012549 [Amanita muscaria]